MTEHDNRSLEERLSRLEHQLEALQKLVASYVQRDQTSATPQQPEAPRPMPPQAVPPPAPTARAAVTPPRELKPIPPKRPIIPAHMRSGEYWLSRIGIGLLLLGLVFLFKYAIDQGWLTPAIRVAFGVALGILLIVLGLRARRQRPQFSPLFLGGGVASFYISGFAAFQLFHLVSHPQALGFMAGVTLLAWVLSIRERQAVLSVIGLVGGLGTPFLLYTESGSMSGLMTYVCLILTGVAFLYLYRGWRTLIMTAAAGAWTVFCVAYYRGVESIRDPGDALWPLQIGILFASLVFWLVPVVRQVLTARSPARWAPPEAQPDPLLAGAEAALAPRAHVHMLLIATPIYALLLSAQLWDLPDRTWGWIVLGAALLYGLVAQVMRPHDNLKHLAFTQLAMSLGLFTLSLSLILSGNTLLVVWAVEVAVLHAVAYRTRLPLFRILGHVLAFIVFVWLAGRLADGSPQGTALVNAEALADLCVIFLGLVSSAFLTRIRTRDFYIIVSYLALAGLFGRELEGNVLMLVLTLQAVLFQLLAAASSDSVLRTAGNVFFLFPAMLLAHRLHLDDARALLEPTGLRPVLNAVAITDLIVIAAATTSVRNIWNRDIRMAFLLSAHVALLVWFLREFGPLTNGQAYVSIAWGVYAIALLILGLRKDWHTLRLTALATLLLVVAKLFLVDLSELEAIWRVLLFMGFGGLFLLISYYFKTLWRSPEQQAGTDGEGKRTV